MYHFVISLCHTASILILVVIAIERYMALAYPFKTRGFLTIKRLLVSNLLASAMQQFPIVLTGPEA